MTEVPGKLVSDPFDSFIESAAEVLELPLEPAWRPAVRTNLQVILAQAALFADFALPDEAEPAPIFVSA